MGKLFENAPKVRDHDTAFPFTPDVAIGLPENDNCHQKALSQGLAA
ncbi:hypothetical protein [Pseudomonas xanthosomatis]